MKQSAEREAVKRQVSEQVDLARTLLNSVEVILLGRYFKERLTGAYDVRANSRELEEARAIVTPYKTAARAQVKLSQSSVLSSSRATEPLDHALVANLTTVGKSSLAVDTNSVMSVLAEASRVIDTMSPADVEQLTFLIPDGDGGTSGGGGGDGGGGGPIEPLPPLPEPSPEPDVTTDMSFEQFPLEVQDASRAAFEQLNIDPIINEAISVAQSGGSVDIGQVNAAITGIVAGAAFGIGGPIGAALSALAFIVLPRMLAEIEKEIIDFDI